MQRAPVEWNMTQTATGPHIPDVAQTLADIGEEFGCPCDPVETNEEYGLRISSYLDEMIEELQLSQDKIMELIA